MSSQEQPGRPLTPSGSTGAPSRGRSLNGTSSSTSLQDLDSSIIAVGHATLSASQNHNPCRNLSMASLQDQAQAQASSSKYHDPTGLDQGTVIPDPSVKIKNGQKQKRSKSPRKQREIVARENNQTSKYAGFRTHNSWNDEERAAIRYQKKDAKEKKKRNAAITMYQEDVRARQSDLTKNEIARDAIIAKNGTSDIPYRYNNPVNSLGYKHATQEANPSPVIPLELLNPMATSVDLSESYGHPVLPLIQNPNPPINGSLGRYENGSYQPSGGAPPIPPINGNGMGIGYENMNYHSNGQTPMNNNWTGGYENGGYPPNGGTTSMLPMNQQINPYDQGHSVPFGDGPRPYTIPAHSTWDHYLQVLRWRDAQEQVNSGNGTASGYQNGGPYSNGDSPSGQAPTTE